jgi:hypothetical protein
MNVDGLQGDFESRLKPLWLRAQAGDEAAYAKALQQIAARLRSYFGRRLRSLPDEVEDLVQETLVAVHVQRGTFDPALPVSAWVFAIARHKLVDLWRRRGRRDALHEPLDDLPEEAHAAAGALAAFGPAPAEMLHGLALWVKLAYAGALAAAAGWLTARLARPVARTAMPWGLCAAVVGVMALVGLRSFTETPPDDRATHVFGFSWLMCPWGVLALSLPALAGCVWALRGLAPTRPRRAGAAAGLFAGALGALSYSLVCPEASLTFVAIWYSLGIALAGLLGALLGPRILRW